MNDVDINLNGLIEKIKLLENDNKKIESTINNINTILKKVDSSVWNSPEKEKTIDILIKYMDEYKNKINPNLKIIITILNEVINKYSETDTNLQKTANSLEVL